MPYHGYAWKLVNPTDNSLGAPASGPGVTIDGSMGFRFIRSFIQDYGYGARSVYNSTYVVNYFVAGSTWINFDDVETVRAKISYAKEKGLLGYNVFQVTNDDIWALSLAEAEFLSEKAYDMWKNGRGIEFIDPFLDDSSSPCKLETCMQVALLCVQENPDARPTMLEAFSMLKSDDSLAIATPEGPGFSEKKKGDMETASSSQQVMCSFDDSQDLTGTLHQKNPQLKTLVTFGGGSSDPKLFARMVSNKGSRNIFIDSAIEVARTYGFDGMDLDWEFPRNQEEMAGMGQLFKEWRVAIKKEAESTHRSPLLLTVAVYFSVQIQWDETPRRYPVESIAESLDWINAMCYDLKRWNKRSAPAALYDPAGNISTSDWLTSWVLAGVPANKVAMGLSLYGRTWKLKDPKVNGIGAPATALGPGDKGILIFSEVEKFNRNNGATVVYDAKTVSTYSHAGTSWIGYDDRTAILQL
ncbi:hypothetical protein DKX38_028451 [Salix brachista]|uniref:GH18 domain-containing protein n=1 Tax=Salix brachista TaxID=2182728 RepID=A0A5N5JAE8_9ROSI|nr:hypothetical protein DKX38_028451 [Salix brachista]